MDAKIWLNDRMQKEKFSWFLKYGEEGAIGGIGSTAAS